MDNADEEDCGSNEPRYNGSEEWILEEEEHGSLSDAQAGLAGFVTGLGVGLVPTVIYRTSTLENREDWDQRRVMHHGAAGAIIAGISLLGLLSEDRRVRKIASAGLGFGVGLALSDLGDFAVWFSEGTLFLRYQSGGGV